MKDDIQFPGMKDQNLYNKLVKYLDKENIYQKGTCAIWVSTRTHSTGGMKSPTISFPYDTLTGDLITKKKRIAKLSNVIWEVCTGEEVPPYFGVFHSCKNGSCVIPEHLFLKDCEELAKQRAYELKTTKLDSISKMIQVVDGCWVWQGQTYQKSGIPFFQSGITKLNPARQIYLNCGRNIPDSSTLSVTHYKFGKPCIHPDHVELRVVNRNDYKGVEAESEICLDWLRNPDKFLSSQIGTDIQRNQIREMMDKMAEQQKLIEQLLKGQKK